MKQQKVFFQYIVGRIDMNFFSVDNQIKLLSSDEFNKEFYSK